ncbi:hypothetical protein HETIRDRAFT_423496 [Heterobasidion irregulare TC 32-1]|uniref:Uncharacterized protein n=1 Tax=Heterobasidion irregulare (strain TC 32-1) TaxID=747525 RepID=W4JMX6_HETIT|nr:uncharacterized protein HETIRDRAFT_423496 [Heterobasidion irregulare TC 32-1]ETW74883.1 hypothetical protein HETIRDRAFT_423496 [Heterobasidion irregulare TC 32-1]
MAASGCVMPASKSQSLDKWMRISHPRRRAHSFLQITPQAKQVEALLRPWKGRSWEDFLGVWGSVEWFSSYKGGGNGVWALHHRVARVSPADRRGSQKCY